MLYQLKITYIAHYAPQIKNSHVINLYYFIVFLHHLDTCHFAKLIPHSIQPLNSSLASLDNIKQIICILCSHSSNKFTEHQKHIDTHHEYIKKNIDKNIYI